MKARVLPEPKPRARQLWGARGCGWDIERDAAVVRVGLDGEGQSSGHWAQKCMCLG